MKFNDSLSLGMRGIRSKPLESGLIILGIALASAVACASLLLLGSQSAESSRILESSAFREVIVRSGDNNNARTQNALREISQDSNRDRISLSDDDLVAIKNQIPHIASAYKYDNENFRTQGGRFGGGGGNAFFGGPQQGQNQQGQGQNQPGQGQAQEQPKIDPSNLLKLSLDNFRGISVTTSFFTAYEVKTQLGNLFTDDDIVQKNSVMVMGENLTKSLFPNLPKEQIIGGKIQVNGQIFTIIGILDEASNKIQLSNGVELGNLSFTPSVDLVFTNGSGNAVRVPRFNSSLRFMVDSGENLSLVYKAIQDYMGQKYGENSISITMPFEQLRLSRDSFNRLLWVLVIFGLGSFAMALINLINMMITRALRKRLYVGILSAMGCSQSELRKLLVFEGGGMALIGTLVGLALALPFYQVLSNAGQSLFSDEQRQIPIDAWSFILSAIGLIVVSFVLSLIPAYQQKNMSPALALKSE